MPINIYASGANRRADAYVYASGANRRVKEMWVYSGGANRRFYIDLSVTLSPPSIDTTASPSLAVTAVASGGSGSYSYSWARISGDTRITANTPSSSSTSFSRGGFEPGETSTATFRCTVSDPSSGASTFADILVRMTRPA